MKQLFLVVVLFMVVGCSSVTPINQTGYIQGKTCKVQVFQTKDQAEQGGEIIEKCVISGTSSGSFSHTPETAIKKHAGKACKCGADKVYVQSRTPMGVGVATVSMVAFVYGGMNQSEEPKPQSSESTSYIDELKALATPRDDGIISEAEFQKQKTEILEEN